MRGDLERKSSKFGGFLAGNARGFGAEKLQIWRLSRWKCAGIWSGKAPNLEAFSLEMRGELERKSSKFGGFLAGNARGIGAEKLQIWRLSRWKRTGNWSGKAPNLEAFSLETHGELERKSSKFGG